MKGGKDVGTKKINELERKTIELLEKSKKKAYKLP